MNLHQRALATVALAIGFSLSAQAETTLSLAYTQPTGTVSPTDTIELWATLTVGGDEAFSFDRDVSSPLFGLTPSLLPTTGTRDDYSAFGVPFASYTDFNLFTSYYCSGNIIGNACTNGAYTVSVPSSPDNWFATDPAYTQQPGTSHDFLLYTLTPNGGSAAPGNYTLYTVGLGLTVHGFDADGNALSADVSALACQSGDASCSFTRTVTAVPEPASWALMLGGGLAVAAAAVRRRRSGSAAR